MKNDDENMIGVERGKVQADGKAEKNELESVCYDAEGMRMASEMMSEDQINLVVAILWGESGAKRRRRPNRGVPVRLVKQVEVQLGN